MVSNQDRLRSRVYTFYSNNLHLGKSVTIRHFLQEGVPLSTIYRILDRFKKDLPPSRQLGSGRKAKIFKKKQIKQLVAMFDHRDGISTRKAAKKFKCAESTVRYTLKNKTDVRYRKKKNIPDRSAIQKALAKTKCGRLIRKFSDRAFVLDDESYFTLSHSTISGNDGFYSSNVSSTSAEVKYAKKKKFEQKVLVWVAISPRGISQALIRKSGFAINAQTYLNECIRRRLIPYIQANFQNGQYVFWPDQASSHYAKIVIDHLRQENINFVEKEDNPANVPEIRPIEDFWALLKSQVYANGWRAQNIPQLITRIKYCLKKIDRSAVRALADSTKKRIDAVRRNGVIEDR